MSSRLIQIPACRTPMFIKTFLFFKQLSFRDRYRVTIRDIPGDILGEVEVVIDRRGVRDANQSS